MFLLFVCIAIQRYIEWSMRVIYVTEVQVVKADNKVKGDYEVFKGFVETLPEDIQERFVEVIKCESHFRQYDSNNKILTHHNENGTIDIGIAQLNSVHFEEAKKMGIDINTTEGNLKFARYLLESKRGINHWVCNSLI